MTAINQYAPTNGRWVDSHGRLTAAAQIWLRELWLRTGGASGAVHVSSDIAGAFMLADDSSGGDDFGIMPGPMGQQGATGSRGQPGEPGEPGEDGQMGPPGQRGVDGAPGPTGPMGQLIFMPGDDGEQGDPGLRGPQGERGPQGAAVFMSGDDGEPGEAGFPGQRGADGAAGATGAQGPMGPAVFLEADIGEDGPIGPPGLPATIPPIIAEPYAPGTFSVPTGYYAQMSKNLTLVSAQRATLAGTARLRID